MFYTDVLCDITEGTYMAWRLKGDGWDATEAALAEFAREESDDEVLTAQGVLERQMSEMQCVALHL
jgi:hypothetical protein